MYIYTLIIRYVESRFVRFKLFIDRKQNRQSLKITLTLLFQTRKFLSY